MLLVFKEYKICVSCKKIFYRSQVYFHFIIHDFEHDYVILTDAGSFMKLIRFFPPSNPGS